MKYFMLMMITTAFILVCGNSFALICPSPHRIIYIRGHWVVLGNLNWREAPFVSHGVHGKLHFGSAMWNNGWQLQPLVERPDCFYWAGNEYEHAHTEFIYRNKTINPKKCYPTQWKNVGGVSKGVICMASARSECYFPASSKSCH